MRVLLYPHNLEIGGVQLLSVDLAAALGRLGHETIVFAPPGPLAELAASQGVRIIEQSRPGGRRPSVHGVRTLRRVIRRERVDLVHAMTHSTALEAYFGALLLEAIPVVSSNMGTRLDQPFPTSLPLIASTRAMQQGGRRLMKAPVHLLEPPVDTETDQPSVDPTDFCREHQLDDDCRRVVIVSRLEIPLKGEGLVRAIDAVTLLSEEMPVRLIIVGGGSIYEQLLERAETANERFGRRVIVLTGPMLDPRPAYAAADVVLGMGGSILRGMAFRKPAILLGVRGFSEVINPSTLGRFLKEGFFGVGDGNGSPLRLSEQLRMLLADEVLRDELGRFSRGAVCERFSLRSASESLERIYGAVLANKPSVVRRLSDGSRFIGSVLVRRLTRLRSARRSENGQRV